MAKCPRLPVAEVKRNLENRVARHDRSVFHDLVADGLLYKPKAKHWRNLAEDPEKHSRALERYAKLAGYVDRKESVHVTATAEQLGETLIARHGEDKAKTVLESMSIPETMWPIKLRQPTTIEAQFTDLTVPEAI